MQKVCLFVPDVHRSINHSNLLLLLLLLIRSDQTTRSATLNVKCEAELDAVDVSRATIIISGRLYSFGVTNRIARGRGVDAGW
jgi:hypothetical protein